MFLVSYPFSHIPLKRPGQNFHTYLQPGPTVSLTVKYQRVEICKISGFFDELPYMNLSKLLNGIVKVLTRICQSFSKICSSSLCISRPLPKKTMVRVDQDFEGC